MEKKKLVLSLLVDVVTIFFGISVWAATKFLIPVTLQGGFCSKMSIGHRLLDEIIPSSVETALYCLLILLTVVVVEFLDRNDQRACRFVSSNKYIVKIFRIQKSLQSITFHGLMLASLVRLGQVFVGLLRPNFLFVCNVRDCWSEYRDFHCQGAPEVVTEARLSFPSGQAAIACYAVFLVVLHVQYRSKLWPLVKSLIQVTVISAAWFSCLCQYTQNLHHTGDIVCGALLGIVFALLAYLDISSSSRLVSSEEKESTTVMGDNGEHIGMTQQ